MLNITFTKYTGFKAGNSIKFAGLVTRRGRAVLAALALGAIAACAPQDTGPCNNAEACAIVKGTADFLKSDIGRDYGSGVTLRDTRAVGQTLLVDIGLPLPATAFNQPLGKGVLRSFAASFASSFCEGPNAGEFFAMGSDIRLRGFSNDNRVVSDQRITSCGGKKT